jgi:AcrR family transcriptional regulator
VAGNRRTGQKAGLSREKVLDAALAVADAQGLDAVGIRAVASALGVTPMAIYRHVESRDDLVAGIGERVLAELELPAPTGEWQEDLRDLARSFRRTVLAHPASVVVLLRRPFFTPEAMRITDAVLAILAAAGFPPERAVALYGQIARFLLALVLFEAESGPPLAAEERAARTRTARAALADVQPASFPHLAEAAPYLTAPFDPERAFESSLDLLVGGLEQVRSAG